MMKFEKKNGVIITVAPFYNDDGYTVIIEERHGNDYVGINSEWFANYDDAVEYANALL